MKKERIELLGVPLDIVNPTDMEEILFSYHEQAGTKQILFLSVWGVLKAKCNPTYLQCLKSAALVLPTSKSIINGATFLKLPTPVRYNPFSTIISLLTALETRYKSLYLFGGRKSSLMESERNIRATYKGLQIVGRYVGYYPKTVEKDIIAAIYKANPSLVLISDGVKEGERWAYDRRNQFGSSFFIYYKDALDIFSMHKKKVSKQVFNRGHEIWFEIAHNPFKIFLLFPFLWYIISLICYKLFKSSKATSK